MTKPPSNVIPLFGAQPEPECTCGGGALKGSHSRDCAAFDESMMAYDPFGKPATPLPEVKWALPPWVRVNATTPAAALAMAQALRDVAEGLERGILQYTAGGLTITNQPLESWGERAVVIDGHLVLRHIKP